ncbi:prenyltransferase/squalene oxidase repeat-containing protein [Bremerella sp. T1]|uniref:prenyltransferase/squalene oxidase repeat-containing protein n=1 Tax=Bremerella sp. TYQ1 TaxID=3119568 RepID=UPI001CCD8201|nr:prenyltransferase/squalene oxidase repeat-containing protein [Bremerella volcania]UBM38702.1 hypothetical protein LA756_12570 [Bremerella volcania]
MAENWRNEDRSSHASSPEEKAWPVYAAYTFFMLYFGASSYLLFDWDHDLWYFNAQVYIAFAAVAWIVGLAVIPLLDISSVRRGIQLSIVLSLMLHLSMFLGMVAIDVGEIADTSLNQNKEKTPKREAVVVPDYSPAQINEDRETEREYEQPVETKEAEAEVDPLEQEKIEHQQPQMKENEVSQEELPREVEPEQMDRREQQVEQPKQETLQDLPSELAKQAREMQQREVEQAQQIEVQRQEQQQPELSAAEAAAQRSAQALEMQRQASNIQEAVQRTTEIQRQNTVQDLPSLSPSQAQEVQRQRMEANNLAQTQADAVEVQRANPQQLRAQAQAAQLARQQSQQQANQPRASAVSPSPTTMASSMAMTRSQQNPEMQIAPSAAAADLARNSATSNLPTVNSTISDNLPRPTPGQANNSQLQPAAGSMARQEVGGDGVEANAVNPGQLWAKPSTASRTAEMVQQHGATRSSAARDEGIVTNDLNNPSIGRSAATGSQAMAGPSTKIDFQGPNGGNQSAANAAALASGQFATPSMNVGRTNGNAADEFGEGQVGSVEVGSPGANLGTDLAGLARGTAARGSEEGSLAEMASGTQGLPAGRSPGASPVLGTQATAEGIPGGGGGAMQPGGGDIAGSLPGLGSVPEIRRRNLGGPAMPSGRPGVNDLAGAPIGSATQPGFIGRRRTSDAPQITTNMANIPVRSPGRRGPLLSTKAAVPTEAFSRRAMRKGGGAGDGAIRPSRETELAIERGLAFLANHQSSDGRWSLRGFAAVHPENFPLYRDELSTLNSDTAATGLALLAFLGAGYDHLSDKYEKEVRDGVTFLVENQKENGDLYIEMDATSNSSCRLYSHAIAALALCEAYGMTQDESLRAAAQKSLDYIEASQDPQLGGWRYTPGHGTDTSVTGWMTLALKSGQLAGLRVDPKSFEGIRKWLASAESRQRGRAVYVYNPYAPNTPQQRHGRDPSQTMTAVGALIQLYLGNRRDSRILQDSADYLKENLPAMGTPEAPLRDTYYWYYATQVMFHMRGDHWEAWDSKLHVMLEQTQVLEGPAAGSWDPKGRVPDRWGGFAGRIYVTTMNLLSLEVYHRHLPIYDDVAN